MVNQSLKSDISLSQPASAHGRTQPMIYDVLSVPNTGEV